MELNKQERMAIDVARRITTQQTPLARQSMRDSVILGMAPSVIELAKGVDFNPADVRQLLVKQQLTAANDIYEMAASSPDLAEKLSGIAADMVAKVVEVSPEAVKEAVASQAYSVSLVSAVDLELRSSPIAREGQRQH